MPPANPTTPLIKADIVPGTPPLFPSNFDFLTSSYWRKTWTQIVGGKFSRSWYSGLLFYEQSTGHAEFYDTNGFGGISLLASHDGWRTSWTHIVPGSFHGEDFTGLLFYDQAAGFGALYDTDGNGNLITLHEYPNWRKSWTEITTIRIPNSAWSGVVFYDQAAGHGEIHQCDGKGGLTLILQSDGWRKSWTQVVGDFFTGTGLLFYEAPTSYGEVYVVTYDNDKKVFGFSLSASRSGLPPATEIIPGNFGSPDTSFLFYNRPTGQGAFVFYDPPSDGVSPWSLGQDPAFPETHTDWRTSWDIIVPGNFWMADPEADHNFQDGFTDLLFYERPTGYAEFYRHDPLDSITPQPLEGFASPGSVLPGETLEFFVNSRVGLYAIDVYRQDADQVLVTSVANIQPYPQPFPIGRLDYRDGPQWPPVAQFQIPQDWPSALYLARVHTPPGVPPVTLDIPFVVRAAIPGSQSAITVSVADTTYAAYNFWGGRGLYGFISRNAAVWNYGPTSTEPDPHQTIRAVHVAVEKPYSDAIGFPKWQQWEVPLLRWLSRQGIAVEVCTASDLHKDQLKGVAKNLLRGCRLLVSVGHDEYWSKEMRDNVEGFAAAGGNVAFFSANVSWWQIRFDADMRKQICYKDANFDPITPTQPNLATVNWYDKPVCRASTSLTGLNYSLDDRSDQYFVIQPNHWVFAGTGLKVLGAFGTYGNGLTVVGDETDHYVPPSSDKCVPGSPANFQRLAEVPIKGATVRLDTLGHPIGDTAATMGIFANGKGQVFTAGTINWSLGLSQDGGSNTIDQITRNVFKQLG